MGAGMDPDTSERTRLSQGEAYLNDRVGSVQTDAFQGHGHTIPVKKLSLGGGDSPMGLFDPNAELGSTPAGKVETGIFVEFGGAGSPRWKTETRPKNANVYMIIYVGRGVR